jgi:hypothetical protein
MLKHYDNIVLVHLFYPDEAKKLVLKLKPIDKAKKCLFLFNLEVQNKLEITQLIQANLKESKIFSFPNKGRDIGAKFFLLNVAFNLSVSADNIIILHDKKSPHLPNSNEWSKNLLSVVDEKYFPEISTALSEPNVGIIASNKYIEDEWDELRDTFRSKNAPIINKILKEIKLKTTDYSFVAGNMFLVKYSIIKSFFTTRNIEPLDIIETLEENNALDFNNATRIHSWERIMCWIVTSQGYKIYGL